MKIKRLSEKAIVPSKGSEYAAGYDLYAVLDVEKIEIAPHETVLIKTGWAMQIPYKSFGAIFARSGIATKQGLRPANCVGIIDSDYRGEVKVALHNDSDGYQIVTDGERIAQLVIMPYYSIDFREVKELDSTERNEGGFGSTGTT
jgi:dUTP pyrophosphatase